MRGAKRTAKAAVALLYTHHTTAFPFYAIKRISNSRQSRLATRSQCHFRSIGENEFHSDSRRSANPVGTRSKLFSSSSPPLEGEKKMSATTTVQMGGFSLVMQHVSSTGSTQDDVRQLLKQNRTDDTTATITTPELLAVSASQQLKGRGTRGRDWIGAPGNCFVTIAVPMDMIPVPITLLPLKIGTIVAFHTMQLLRRCGSPAKTSVKWPNDVLVDDGKIAGILIENDSDVKNNYWFLVGIGVNVGHAPTVDATGPQRGRRATCLRDHCSYGDCDDDDVDMARELAAKITRDIARWVSQKQPLDQRSAARDVVSEWENWAEWGKEQVLRDKPGNQVVIPVGIEPDGRLRVMGRNGTVQYLSADYIL